MTAAHLIPPARNAVPAIAAAIPELTTERLRLRAPTLADVPVLDDINDSVRDVSMRDTANPNATWLDFTQMTAVWVLRGHGWWTVDDANGACGFVGIGFEAGDFAPELGYLLAPAARGKGYATEACHAARDFARNVMDLPELISFISDRNTASQNVARKLGATRDAAAEAALGEDGVQIWRHWGGAA